MNSMMSMPGWRCSMIAVSALALLSGCVTAGQAPPRIAENNSQPVRKAFQESASTRGEIATSDGVFTETRYLPYEKNALYKLRAAVGSSSTIELQPGETLINYTLGDGSLWIVDDVAGGDQTLLQVEPTAADISTHLLINTDKRSYLVEATSHEVGNFETALGWTYPHEQVDQPITAREAEDENPDEGTSFSWSRWFSSLPKTSSTDPRGCRLCRDPDDHGDNDHGRDHDTADHH